MTVHELKTVNPYFQEVWDKKKTFEVRKNDRGYKVGDVLHLKEWLGNSYSGREILCDVDYILKGGKYGVDKDHCVMTITVFRKINFIDEDLPY